MEFRTTHSGRQGNDAENHSEKIMASRTHLRERNGCMDAALQYWAPAKNNRLGGDRERSFDSGLKFAKR